MLRKANITKWITFLIFLAAIIFIVILAKNKGSFAATISDIKNFF